MKAEFPILEFDPSRDAMVEPSRVIKSADVPERCVITFFKEVVDKVVTEQGARIAADHSWSDGPHPIYEISFQGERLAFFHPGIGGGLSAGLLEEAIACGCRKFIVCGGCGVLDKEIAVGNLVVISAALRDEGVSYHYLPPGREIPANPAAVSTLTAILKARGLPYRLGKTWTTDAPYRETPAVVAARRHEGCLVVEMEAACLMAVAEYRRTVLGLVLYGGDDLSGTEWDNRGWQNRHEIRENLFWLAAQACLEL